MKKLLLFIILLCAMVKTVFAENTQPLDQEYKYPKMDFDLKLYLVPSWFGIVSGKSDILGKMEESEVTDCWNFLVESRGDIFSVGNFAFSWSFGFGAYLETPQEEKKSFDAFQVTLGAGVFFTEFSNHSLTGPCLYLYPVYEIPIITGGGTPYYKWKSAVDLGLNFSFLDTITIYPYIRNILGWNKGGVNYMFDFGVALGIYIEDRHYAKKRSY